MRLLLVVRVFLVVFSSSSSESSLPRTLSQQSLSHQSVVFSFTLSAPKAISGKMCILLLYLLLVVVSSVPVVVVVVVVVNIVVAILGSAAAAFTDEC